MPVDELISKPICKLHEKKHYKIPDRKSSVNYNLWNKIEALDRIICNFGCVK